MFVKHFSGDKQEVRLNKLKSWTDIELVRASWDTARSQEAYCFPKMDLDSMSSAHHATKKNYLGVKILDRYYNMNDNFSGSYFVDGTYGLLQA